MRTCPHCKGKISETARKCKHCGEWVVENKNNFQDEKTKNPQIKTENNDSNFSNTKECEEVKKNNDKIIWLIICIIIICIVIFEPLYFNYKYSQSENYDFYKELSNFIDKIL